MGENGWLNGYMESSSCGQLSPGWLCAGRNANARPVFMDLRLAGVNSNPMTWCLTMYKIQKRKKSRYPLERV